MRAAEPTLLQIPETRGALIGQQEDDWLTPTFWRGFSAVVFPFCIFYAWSALLEICLELGSEVLEKTFNTNQLLFFLFVLLPEIFLCSLYFDLSFPP